MTFGTVLTLFVVPTAYTFLARDRSRAAAEAEAARPVRQAAE
jgi:multidrug efflux pump